MNLIRIFVCVCVVCQDVDGYILRRLELSSRLASVLLCDGIDRILNVSRQLVMVSICHSLQKRLGYDCVFVSIPLSHNKTKVRREGNNSDTSKYIHQHPDILHKKKSG